MNLATLISLALESMNISRCANYAARVERLAYTGGRPKQNVRRWPPTLRGGGRRLGLGRGNLRAQRLNLWPLYGN